jgi:hypothetical protein
VPKKLVAFVVGHERWGKSLTLRALERLCGHQGRQVTISDVEFFVRKMSNDDKPDSYINFVSTISRPHVIAALCPKFKKFGNCDDPRKLADAILRRFKGKGYSLFFWVIEHKWDSTDVVNGDEIRELRNYGTVKVFRRAGVVKRERAREFRAFISNAIRTL